LYAQLAANLTTEGQLMQVRTPNIGLETGPLLWSSPPEFSMTYVGASTVIPYVEFFLNSVMKDIATNHCAAHPQLKSELAIFIKQETAHAKYHHQFNRRVFETIPELKAVADGMTADLKAMREKRSIAFCAAYCAGFETIATYDAKYLYEHCQEFFAGADPHGANLLLWHVAEEFEHRAVCLNAFAALSGNYLRRVIGALYAFWHVGGAFLRAEKVVQEHYRRNLSEGDRQVSQRRSKHLFRRHLRYLVPGILRVLVPGYDAAKVAVPDRIAAALKFFETVEPIHRQPLSVG
jgi:uncharacterized protein